MRIAGCTAGWNGSEPAAGALRWAAEREDRRGGVLRIVHVLEATSSDGDPGNRVRAARRELDAQCAALSARYPSVNLEAEIRVGDRVVQLAAASRGALLVVGAHAGGVLPPPRGLAVALASRAGGITVIVPARHPAERFGVVALLAGEGRSTAAALFAAQEAAERREPLTLVRVDGTRRADRFGLLQQESSAVAGRFPALRWVVDERWVHSPSRALRRAERASLLVLERGRSDEELGPDLEGWLASREAGPVAVVSESVAGRSQGAGDSGTVPALAG